VACGAATGAAAQPAAPAAAAETPPGVTFLDSGEIEINVSTPEEGKLAIKQLKQKKKEYTNLRKGVTTDISELNAERRVEVANEAPRVRYGGDRLKKTVRAVQMVGQEAHQREWAAELAPLEERKAALDRQILEIDTAITTIEGQMLQWQGSS
jgi:hypothetical protein